MNVDTAAGRLFDLLASKSNVFTRHFVQGMAAEEIASLAKFHQTTLPDEVGLFYQAYNLPSGYQSAEGRPRLFGDYYLLGLQQMLVKKNTISELAAEFFPEWPGSRDWLPFMQADAGYYLLDTVASEAGTAEQDPVCPVLFMLSGSDPDLRFAGIAAMFDTFSDWLEEEIVPFVNGGLGSTDKANRSKLAQVALRHNPAVEFWQDMAG